MRLDFASAKDQLQLFFTFVLGLLTLFIFSSSTPKTISYEIPCDEVRELVEKGIERVKRTCNICEGDNDIKECDYNYDTKSGQKEATRGIYILICLVSNVVVYFIVTFEKSWLIPLRDRIRTTLPRRFSPLYRYFFDLGIVIGLVLIGSYAYLAQIGDENAEKLRRVCKNYFLILITCCVIRLFSVPTNTHLRRQGILCAAALPLFMGLSLAANVLQGDSLENEHALSGNIVWLIGLIHCTLMTLRSRTMLAQAPAGNVTRRCCRRPYRRCR